VTPFSIVPLKERGRGTKSATPPHRRHQGIACKQELYRQMVRQALADALSPDRKRTERERPRPVR
jgi:hypothetical protein